MSRLPTVGRDNGNWGAILNDYLSQEHNPDGSLKIRTDGTLSSGIADGSITASKLSPTVNNYLASAQTAVQTVNGKSGTSVTLAASDISGVATLTGGTLTSSQVPTHLMSENDGVYVATKHGVTTSVSGCSTALQSLLNTAASAGFAVYLPPGTYILDTAVGIPAGTHLFGAGPSSVLKLKSAFPTAHPLYNAVTSGFTDVYLHDFAIDGNAAGQSGDQTLNGSPNELLFMSSASGTPGARINVERIYAHDSYRLGIVFQNITDFSIRDCQVANNGRDGITCFDGCKRGVISGNRVKGCNDDHIALNSENGLCENITVTANVLTGPGTRGVGKGVRVLGGRNVTVSANTIDSVCEDGILVADYEGNALSGCSITGNTIRSTGTGGSGSKIGIRVHTGYSAYHPTTYSGITDLVVANNTVVSAGGGGIELRTDHATEELARVKVRGNIISSCAGEGIATTTGGTAYVCDVDISDNTCYLNAGHGVFSNLAKRARICGNTTYNNGTGGTNTTGVRVNTDDMVIVTGNMAYETRAGGSRTQTIGIYINGNGTATSVLWKDNLAYNMTTGWSSNSIPGLATLEGAFNKVPVLKQTVTGAKGSNAALGSLLTALSNYGVITDSSSA